MKPQTISNTNWMVQNSLMQLFLGTCTLYMISLSVSQLISNTVHTCDVIV